MKKSTLALVLVAIVIAVYSLYWYYVAENAEKRFAHAVQRWNSEHPEFGEISYTGMRKGGYPFHIAIILDNLHYRSGSASPMQVDAAIDGKVTLSDALFSHDTSIAMHGLKRVILNDPPHNRHYEVTLKGDSSLKKELTHEHFEQLRRYLAGEEFPFHEDWLEEFTYDIDADHMTIAGYEGKEMLFNFDAGPIKLSLDKEGRGEAPQELYYDVDLQGLKLKLPPPNESESTLADALSKYFSYEPKLYDNATFKVSGKACFPSVKSWQEIVQEPWAQRDVKFCVEADEMAFSSPGLAWSWKYLKLILEQQGLKYTFKYGNQGTSQVNKLYDEVLAKNMTGFLNSPGFLNTAFESEDAAKESFRAHIPAVVSLLPQFHELGKTSAEMDLVAGGILTKKNDVDNDRGVKEFFFHLNDYSQKVGQYDFQLQTLIDSTDYLAMTEGKGFFSLSHYRECIRDLVNYHNRITSTFNSLKIPQLPVMPVFSERHTEEVIALLKALSDDGGKGDDIKISFYFDGEGNGKIGTLPLGDALAKIAEVAASLQTAF